ncbi:Pyridoxine 4-dehydrogenase [Orbilia javanica]|uniref:Pyridoxine 4-dehydrogenase n=1 Tax=Orbilia javanica TaxID=47235 RepID=A0AAN8MYK2_9PEZI
MTFTGRPFVIPDAEIFASINTSLSHGANFFVSGEFYGIRDPEDNLHMLKRYFTAHPEASDKVVLSVKAGMNWATLSIFGKENISCVELEVSLWATEIFENGVAEVCREFGIPIAAYSPLGRGFLTGQFKSADDLPEGDVRKHFDRFKLENFGKNLELVEMVKGIAERKGCTVSQLGLGWVRQVGGWWGGLRVIPIFGATKQAQVAENLRSVELTDSEMAEIDEILKSLNLPEGDTSGTWRACCINNQVIPPHETMGSSCEVIISVGNALVCCMLGV